MWLFTSRTGSGREHGQRTHERHVDDAAQLVLEQWAVVKCVAGVDLDDAAATNLHTEICQGTARRHWQWTDLEEAVRRFPNRNAFRDHEHRRVVAVSADAE